MTATSLTTPSPLGRLFRAIPVIGGLIRAIERELDTIRTVKDTVKIPVLANGDIIDVPSALSTLEQTGCDGLMIGRGAIRDPWVFRKIEAALAGRRYPEVDTLERKRVLLGYLEAIRPYFKTDHSTLGRFKKIAKHSTDGVEGGDVLKTAVLHSATLDGAILEVERFFEGQTSVAR